MSAVIAQNIGRGKFWWIWAIHNQFAKFYLQTFLSGFTFVQVPLQNTVKINSLLAELASVLLLKATFKYV